VAPHEAASAPGTPGTGVVEDVPGWSWWGPSCGSGRGVSAAATVPSESKFLLMDGEPFEVKEGHWRWTRYKVNCTKGKKPCDTYDCLQAALNNANLNGYDFTGPNSNTFAHALLEKCGCKVAESEEHTSEPLESGPIPVTIKHDEPAGATGWDTEKDFWGNWNYEWGK